LPLFSDERKTVLVVEDVTVRILVMSPSVVLLQMEESPYSLFYFDSQVLEDNLIDGFGMASGSLVPDVRLKITGTVKEGCEESGLSFQANPILITKVEKLKTCEQPFEENPLKDLPVKNTRWKLIGFRKADQTLEFPPCESPDWHFSLTDTWTENDQGFNLDCELSHYACIYKYKELSQNKFQIIAEVCVASVPETTYDVILFAARYADALSDPDGITTEAGHNILYVYCAREEGRLEFISVD
jgi:hypothetical protein